MVTAVLSLAISAFAKAGPIPFASIESMCKTADLVVAGVHEEQSTMRITDVFKAKGVLPKVVMHERIGRPPIVDVFEIDGALLKAGDQLRLEVLNKLSRNLFDMKAKGAMGPEIETKKFVVFANLDEHGELVPVLSMMGGSRGVIWYDKKNSYGYTQQFNPGPFVLVDSSRISKDIPAGKEKLWERIEAGLKQQDLQMAQ